ncbi:unnamed protein product, partial [Symbiodinium sp. CCMP2456]
MVKSFVSNVVPKKVKLRSVQKRSAAKESTTGKNVKYVREKCAVGPRGQRKDQIKWKGTLHQLLRASDKEIINIPIADKFIPKWEGKTCPPAPTAPRPSCSSIPAVASNIGAVMAIAQSLQTQAAHTILKLRKIPQSNIHLLLDINHNAIEDMEKKICKLRLKYVEKKEKEIVFGDGKSWKEIEADGATFDRRDISQGVEFKHLIQSKDCVMMWERKIEWKALGFELLRDRKVILRTDSAKSYKLNLPGVARDK